MDIDNRCLDEKRLSSYLDEKISDSERKAIEAHIADCNICLDMLLVAYEAQKKRFSTRPLRGLARTILFERKKRANQAGTVEKIRKKRPELKWLLMAMAAFGLSFVFRGYFLQFLAIGVVLGFKWAMEGEGAKRVVMIFKGMKDKDAESHKEDAVRVKKFSPR